jgi:hypothetical protein
MAVMPDLSKQQLQQIESSEMRFLRSVAGYRIMDKKRNIDIRQKLNIFNLGEKVKENQWNYFEQKIFYEYQLIKFLGCCLTTTLKEEEREAHH